MRLDELVDILVQPQQDQQVKLEIDGELYDITTERVHQSGNFILTPVKVN